MNCKLPRSKASVWFEVCFKQTVRGVGAADEGRYNGRGAEVTEEDKGAPGRGGHTNVMMKNGARETERETGDGKTMLCHQSFQSFLFVLVISHHRI